ncbi:MULTISPECIES: DsbA family protein [Stappiaceae]|jgi:protein-disulfide isomerase|uniref:DsbA family protein n=1 Tax=Stappiaceae TaxID=2821832 RepID=UPI00094AF10B|nr:MULTISPECIES: DsbA family protein [Stappiaceae]MBO9463219.1 thioredoxin domain-containing protein [Labrenzia sp. R5_0]UES53879.1 thioredoxin domain-containing protein [Roseibium aggregatum]UFI06777.1 DsbA family protein [Roseibium aggregatum]
MNFRLPSLGTVLIALLFTASTASADQEEGLTEARIKELALEAILENPEIIEQAIGLLQQKQLARQQADVASILAERRNELEEDPNAPVLGNPAGDVTLVEFFDYNCPYCKRAMQEVKTLLQADPNIRLVYREWPILSPGSIFAARAALAARKQGKYEEFHWALMGFKGKVEEGSTIKIAKEVGLDVEKLKVDMLAPEIEEHIRLSMNLAEALNINGTPAFIAGEKVYPGLLTSEQLSQAIEDARSAQ